GHSCGDGTHIGRTVLDVGPIFLVGITHCATEHHTPIAGCILCFAGAAVGGARHNSFCAPGAGDRRWISRVRTDLSADCFSPEAASDPVVDPIRGVFGYLPPVRRLSTDKSGDRSRHAAVPPLVGKIAVLLSNGTAAYFARGGRPHPLALR